MIPFGRIGEIWRYPVSSMSGEKLDRAELNPGGIVHDRIWGICAAESGEIAAPENRKAWRALPNLFSRMGEDGPEIGSGEAAWFPVASRQADAFASRFMGFPVRLMPHVSDAAEAGGAIAPRYARADIHLLSTASMRHLASLLEDPSQVHARRFRPNIVVETEPGFQGLVEQAMVGRRLMIGDAVVEITEPCARCTFTALAQGDLAFSPAVLHTISRYGQGGFGAQCRVTAAATIRVGDRLSIIEA